MIRCLYMMVFLCHLTWSCASPGDDSSWESRVPEKTEVGTHVLPDTVAPVDAPFPAPAFAKPVFPEREIIIRSQETTAAGLYTSAIQSAIDELSAQGGGRVVIPGGRWQTGRLELKNNVNLHLAEGAEVTFSASISDYLPAVFTRNEGIELYSLGACIYANGQRNIAVTGKGRLIGPGNGSIRRQTMTHDVIENVVPLDRPVSGRVYEGRDGGIIFPPMMISPINCQEVYIEGVTLENSAFWNVVPVYCDQVIIRGITVNSVGIARGDGIDVESSRNVLIEYCTLNTGDDCLAIKAGRGEDGLRVNRPSENIIVRYCLARQGHGGITIGSETAGMVRNLYVHDCVFDGTGVGIRFKTRRPRGGGGEYLYYERIRMRLEHTALRWDMLGSAVHVGELATNQALPVNAFTPRFRNISIKHIIVESAAEFMKVDGIPESPLTGVRIDGVKATSDRLMQVRQASDITIRNALLTSPDSVIRLENARDFRIEHSVFDVPGGKPHWAFAGSVENIGIQ